ncbi:MAG: chemotaxis protein CheW [Gammaproteobacteria bacterium]|nr:chemotaxis protein CheW [Gammaproteobacteria bacterium]MCW8987491.1 chemotaxis protein CheW [Gammaproteobacteria bacterium]
MSETTDEKKIEGDATQFLTFILDDEAYGVEILRVQEIKGWTPVTRIPNTPKYMQGVLNLRGTIVPIVDMRMRFDLQRVEYTPVTVIIVLSVKSESGERVIGLVVDSVSDVIDVNAKDIKATPNFGTTLNTEFINGLATSAENMVMLLDVDKLLSVDEMTALAQISDANADVRDEE